MRDAKRACKHCALRGRTTHILRCAQIEAHLVPQMVETQQIENDESGISVDMPQVRAPWSFKRQRLPNGTWGEGTLSKRPLETKPGTKANAGLAPVREILVRGVQIFPFFMYCFDGATTLAACKTSLNSDHGDPFSKEKSNEFGRFHSVRKLPKGESITSKAEAQWPGCSDTNSKMHHILKYICRINDHARNSELQALTRQPERQPEQKSMTSGVGGKAKKTAAILGSKKNTDGKTESDRPYADPDIRALNYAHDSFKPGINGAQAGAEAKQAPADCLIRWPVEVESERDLQDLSWNSYCEPWMSRRILSLFGMCIVHCGMRTAESCVTLMLTVARERYVSGSARDKRAINNLNTRVVRELSVRKLITLNEKGALNKVSFNGDEVRILIADLCSGSSVLMEIIKTTYSRLDGAPGDDVTHLAAWLVVMRHWAVAMKAAYQLRATEADRQTFRENVRLYVTAKAEVRPGETTWYDYQLYGRFTKLFDKYKSLMVISQEGMEACQKGNNRERRAIDPRAAHCTARTDKHRPHVAELMRMSNNFANGGRVPNSVKENGREAVLAYQDEKRTQKYSPARWLWWRNLFSFMSNAMDVFQRSEKYKKDGHMIDWKEDFVPEYESMRTIATIYRILIAKHRWNKAVGRRVTQADDTARTITVSYATQFAARAVKWTRLDDGRTFNVTVYDERRARLVEEVRAYYAPAQGSILERLEQLDETDTYQCDVARKLIQRDRRKRWAKAKRSDLWVAHPEDAQ